MAKESKLIHTLHKAIEQHGEGRADWLGAMANDDAWSLWSLPILSDLLEFFRPYYILLVSEDRIVINKISWRHHILSSKAASRSELKDFVFKKGMLLTKVRMKLPDGTKYRFSFFPAKMYFSNADTHSKAMEVLEAYSK